MEPERFKDLFQRSRWQMLDTDFYSYFCIYLFCLCRGMNEPLFPKAITAYRAQAHFYADVTFYHSCKIKPSQDNLSQM